MFFMPDKDLQILVAEYMQVRSAGNENILDEYADEELDVDYTHFRFF